DITTTGATLNMDYTVGDYASVQVRFDYKKTADAVWSNTAWVTKSASGSHSETLTGLDSGTEYQFNATLKYDGTTIYGGVRTFTTLTPAIPTVTTKPATGITTTSATLNMDYTVGDYVGYTTVQVRFAWRQVGAAAWTYTTWVTKTASGSHSESITGLTIATEYEFKAQLQYDTTLIEGETKTFYTVVTDKVVIRDAPDGGGMEITGPFAKGMTYTLYAAGYNKTTNQYTGPVSGTWSISPPEGIASVDPESGESTNLTGVAAGTFSLTFTWDTTNKKTYDNLKVIEIAGVVVWGFPFGTYWIIIYIVIAVVVVAALATWFAKKKKVAPPT
ncbi:MAG: hypothetical protein QMD21_07645, partial [Candidatus Thermoplasmatota archaeon]|nr:hypothetical protein [Candidatus Thermoplasmatota archaeon]